MSCWAVRLQNPAYSCHEPYKSLPRSTPNNLFNTSNSNQLQPSRSSLFKCC
ncbi:unnamed protein product [Meloidogyne enterolobii]|uniref:Uncharacterized protein n=1 Tax=Meloidogyne enterolobii TaxID=390850 RepID=A0ACB0YWV6_MELEN